MPTPVIPFDPLVVRQKVPAALRERPQWVVWRYDERNGKPTKHPVDPTKGGSASSTDPATWGTFAQAMAAVGRCPDLAGIGFVFARDDPFAGIDLDKCIDTSDRIKPWAIPILGQLNSYTEVSPSGTGVKVFVRARKNGPRCKTSYEDGAIEMYDADRFFTMTGQHLLDTPAEVQERQAQYDSVYDVAFSRAKASAPASSPNGAPPTNRRALLDDDEIVRLASRSRRSGAKFAELFAGQWEGHFGSASEADSSVVFTLAFYTKHVEQIDRIFRRSALMRDKWDERHGAQTYGEMTIANALAEVTAQYRARRPKGETSSAPGHGQPPSCDDVSTGPQPGTFDPGTGRLILSTGRTLPTAEAFVRQFHHHEEGMTLRQYAGVPLIWQGNRYVEVEDGALRSRLLPWLHAAVRMRYEPRSESWVPTDFPANPQTVNAALESIKAHTHLSASVQSPSWLGDGDGRPDPLQIVPCKSFLLHVPTMARIAPTPAFFNVNATDYDYDPNAPEPTLWRLFLGELFEDDLQSWDLLQEWAGYCLTGDTSQQKMLLIVGPRRSGKGTIARVLTALVGKGNVAAPTTSSLAGNFGLQPLIGKSLAIVSDARFSGENIQTVVERLLCISGEDSLTIERKYLPAVTMKLPTRFVFLTNELPRLSDASGALAGRFMILRLTQSFFGSEDTELTAKLLRELVGILNWSLGGYRHLRERKRFVQPASVEETMRELEDLSSPVQAFIRQRCEIAPGLRIWVDDLYAAWKAWCEADGRAKPTTKQTLGRDLMAAVPGVSTRQGTNGVRFYQGIQLKGSCE